MLCIEDNTYRLTRYGDETEFGNREFVDLGRGASQSLDGELSFSPDGSNELSHRYAASLLSMLYARADRAIKNESRYGGTV